MIFLFCMNLSKKFKFITYKIHIKYQKKKLIISNIALQLHSYTYELQVKLRTWIANFYNYGHSSLEESHHLAGIFYSLLSLQP